MASKPVYVPPWKRNQASTSTEPASSIPSSALSSCSSSSRAFGPTGIFGQSRRYAGASPQEPTWHFEQIADKIGTEGHTLTPFTLLPVTAGQRGCSTGPGSVAEQLKRLRMTTSEERYAASIPQATRRQGVIDRIVARQEPAYPLSNMISWLKIVPNAHPNFDFRSQDPNAAQELWLHTGSEMLDVEPRNIGRPIPAFGGGNTSGGNSRFLGYWIIKSSHKVEPHSQEMIAMLEPKDKMSSIRWPYPRKVDASTRHDKLGQGSDQTLCARSRQPKLINPMEHDDFKVREVDFETKVFESEIVARIARLDERDCRRAATAEVEGKLAASSWRVGEKSMIAVDSEADHKTEEDYEIVERRSGALESKSQQGSVDDWEELGSDADDERPATAADASCENTGDSSSSASTGALLDGKATCSGKLKASTSSIDARESSSVASSAKFLNQKRLCLAPKHDIHDPFTRKIRSHGHSRRSTAPRSR